MVPNGWTPSQVGDIAKFSSGGTPSKQQPEYWGGTEPWISGKDLKTHYLETSIDTLTEAGFQAAKKAPKGASLILVRGMTLLKDFPVGYATREVAFNQDLKALVPAKNVDGLFLSFLLVAEKHKILQLVSTAGHGTGRLDTDSIQNHPVNLPPVSAQMPTELGYELLARRPDLQVAHWYIEASLSEVDAAKAAFYPDINLMAFLQQDALHLSDLFRHSAQQMGLSAGLTLPVFDSGRLNANLDIASAQNNLSVAKYNKAVVDAVNQVAKTASQVETLMEKNQQQQQVEKDAQRTVNLAEARMSAGILPGSRVSMARLPALQERITALRLRGQWLDASIQLTSALGGGYHQTTGSD